MARHLRRVGVVVGRTREPAERFLDDVLDDRVGRIRLGRQVDAVVGVGEVSPQSLRVPGRIDGALLLGPLHGVTKDLPHPTKALPGTVLRGCVMGRAFHGRIGGEASVAAFGGPFRHRQKCLPNPVHRRKAVSKLTAESLDALSAIPVERFQVELVLAAKRIVQAAPVQPKVVDKVLHTRCLVALLPEQFRSLFNLCVTVERRRAGHDRKLPNEAA